MALTTAAIRKKNRKMEAARAAAGQPRPRGRPPGFTKKRRGRPPKKPSALEIYNAKKRAEREAAGGDVPAPAEVGATTPKLRSNGHETILREISPLLEEKLELPSHLSSEVLRHIAGYCGPMKKHRPKPEGPPRRSGRERKSREMFVAAPAINEKKRAAQAKAWANRRAAQLKKEGDLRMARMMAEEARRNWIRELGRQAREGRAKIVLTSDAQSAAAGKGFADMKQGSLMQTPTKGVHVSPQRKQPPTQHQYPHFQGQYHSHQPRPQAAPYSQPVQYYHPHAGYAPPRAWNPAYAAPQYAAAVARPPHVLLAQQQQLATVPAATTEGAPLARVMSVQTGATSAIKRVPGESTAKPSPGTFEV